MEGSFFTVITTPQSFNEVKHSFNNEASLRNESSSLAPNHD